MHLSVCVGVACAGAALAAPKTAPPAAPKVDANEKHKLAVKLVDNGKAENARAVIEEGLALAPTGQSLLILLELMGRVLLTLRDYPGALAAYQAYVDAGAKGAKLRVAQKIIGDLEAVKSTFLDITLANGPAAIYLDSKTLGVFCTAAPSCHLPMLPGEYKVIAERSGFERWAGPRRKIALAAGGVGLWALAGGVGSISP